MLGPFRNSMSLVWLGRSPFNYAPHFVKGIWAFIFQKDDRALGGDYNVDKPGELCWPRMPRK